MPFVNIQILKGHSQERKDEMSRRISETIREVAELPEGADVWVVWEDVTQEDWFVNGKSVKAIRSSGT
jgi:4-oxalocrotonate tautomerase